MAMTVGASSAASPEVFLDINTTPLIDVMLVLLIMLIITLPIQLHAVSLNNPVGHPPPPLVQPEVVRVDIDAGNSIRWNGEPLGDTPALEARLAAAAAQTVAPEIHLRPDKAASYKTVAYVMASVQKHGLSKVGLVGNEQFIQ
jgi:biopolymer transport protein ExbD